MSVTRTIGPLHFEDLEPHRFEDLVRQLAYSFRDWHVIEATGRLGADDGVDIRAVQRTLRADGDRVEEGEGEDEKSPTTHDRIWHFQCKRQRRIGPKRLAAAIDECFPGDAPPPYGFIFVASCDFSKKSRDVFRTAMADLGVEEFQLWGKAELEDLLFRPRNDHLLFAYFGVSLQSRRRSKRAEFASRIRMKKQLLRVLDGGLDGQTTVLIRDASADHYPVPAEDDDFQSRPPWRFYRCIGHRRPDHLVFVVREFFAWADFETGEWDYLPHADTSWIRYPQLAWVEAPDNPKEELCRRYWRARVPNTHRALYRRLGTVPYDAILAVDSEGDIIHEGPHVIVEYQGERGPFSDFKFFIMPQGAWNQQSFEALDELRVRQLPEEVPEISDEELQASFRQ